MRASIIVNEKANWGSGRHKVRRVMTFLSQQGLASSVFFTQYRGHAQELAAAAAAQGSDAVIVVGGDGTVNEVSNGLLASGRDPLPCLGLIPAGSSNDFSKSLGIPQRLSEACRVLVERRVREVDVGQAGFVPAPGDSPHAPGGSALPKAGPRYFCSASCLGYFAEVAARSLEMKRLRGSWRYVVPAFGVIRTMTAGWDMTVRTEGREFHGEYAVLLVGNAPRFGGLTMLPGACPDDGLLDGLLVEMASKWEALRLLPLLYRQALERHQKVTRFRAASFSVTLSRPSRICDDGEIEPDPVQNLEYRVLPRRLRVLC